MIREHDNGLPLTAIDQYMRQVKLIPQLTDEEEERLLLCIASGVDARQARERMVEGYQQMIVNLARRYARNCHHLDVLDLAQEGSEGFLRAVEKYDVNMGVASFRTLAYAWVRGSMLMAYWRYERALRIPFNKVRAIRQMNNVSVQLSSALGREPTRTEIARKMGCQVRDIQELVVLQDQHVVSLYAPLEDGETFLEEVLEDSMDTAPADDAGYSADEVLATLTKREQEIIQLRYGLVNGRAYTQKEIAARLGVSPSRVAVLEHRAKMRLRQALDGSLV